MRFEVCSMPRLIILLSVLLIWPSMAALAADTDALHLGVASCAGSTCHGASSPVPGANVQLNEYVTWVRHDKHAKAHEALFSAESKRIARNLGLGAPEREKLCLDCHADNPPADKRGPTFQISEGVGCEGCHGGGEKWLSSHTSNPPRADNIAAGMYPTDEPKARAELCLSCHFGTKDKFVTHRIMGAGHPRMSFELDTFTQIQPAHFVIDDDYRKRKAVSNGAKTWAIGQAIYAREVLAALSDPKRNRDGIFPEFVLFDCHSCHTQMSNQNWRPRSSGSVTPGMPHVNDANLIMLRILTKPLDPALANSIAAKTRALQRAAPVGMDRLAGAARDLHGLMNQMADKFAANAFDAAQVSAMLDGLVQAGLDGEYQDYAAAEQATMAIDSLIATISPSLPEAKQKALGAALDAVYAAVKKDEAYQPGRYAAALKGIRGAVGG